MTLSNNTKGMNSSSPSTAEIVGGVYNVVPPVLTDGQAAALQLDVNGKLITSSSGGGGGGGNVNITGINGPPPALANPLPVELSDGTNPLGTDVNPIRTSPSSTAAVQPVSISGTVPVSGTVTVVQPTGTNLHVTVDGTVPVSGTVAVSAIAGALPPGTNVIGHVITDTGSTTVVTGNVVVTQSTGTNLHVVVDSAPSTPVTGTVTANQGTAAVPANKWPIEIVDSGGVNVATVTAANAVKVDGSAVTQPISGAVTVTSTTVTNTVADNLIQVGGAAVSLGAKTSALSIPVVLATDEAALPVKGTLTNNNAAPAANNEGVLGFLANAASPTYTEGDQVLGSVDLSGRLRTLSTLSGTSVVAGTLTNNNAAPAATNVGSLVALANAVAPTWTEGDQVLMSTDLKGNQRVAIRGNAGGTLDAVQGAAAPANELVVGGVFNSTPVVLTTGLASQLQLDTTGALFINTQSNKQTYRMAVVGFTPVASATSPLFSIQGSATKTVRIIHIKISWSSTTGNATNNDIFMQRFSALTGGTTGNTPTGALLDTTNAAQTAVCLQYSAVPTVATAVGGFMAAERMSWVTSGVTVPYTLPIVWDYGFPSSQLPVLRGVAQYFGIVVKAVGAAAPLMTIRISWTEE